MDQDYPSDPLDGIQGLPEAVGSGCQSRPKAAPLGSYLCGEYAMRSDWGRVAQCKCVYHKASLSVRAG